MTHDELREKVARALCHQSSGAEIMWKQWLPDADAALAAVRDALREPSDGMEVAADERNDEEPPNSWGKHRPAPFAEIWKAMLAASPLAEPRHD